MIGDDHESDGDFHAHVLPATEGWRDEAMKRTYDYGVFRISAETTSVWTSEVRSWRGLAKMFQYGIDVDAMDPDNACVCKVGSCELETRFPTEADALLAGYGQGQKIPKELCAGEDPNHGRM